MKSPDFRSAWTTWRCRRNANFFILSLVGLFVILILHRLLTGSGIDRPALVMLPVAVIGLGIWMVRVWLQRRSSRNQRYERRPLSRDELHKARSKLVKVAKRS